MSAGKCQLTDQQQRCHYQQIVSPHFGFYSAAKSMNGQRNFFSGWRWFEWIFLEKWKCQAVQLWLILRSGRPVCALDRTLIGGDLNELPLQTPSRPQMFWSELRTRAVPGFVVSSAAGSYNIQMEENVMRKRRIKLIAEKRCLLEVLTFTKLVLLNFHMTRCQFLSNLKA